MSRAVNLSYNSLMLHQHRVTSSSATSMSSDSNERFFKKAKLEYDTDVTPSGSGASASRNLAGQDKRGVARRFSTLQEDDAAENEDGKELAYVGDPAFLEVSVHLSTFPEYCYHS